MFRSMLLAPGAMEEGRIQGLGKFVILVHVLKHKQS